MNRLKAEINIIVDLIHERDPNFGAFADQISAELAMIFNKSEFEIQMQLKIAYLFNKK